jgi:hypothetical protein
VTSDILANCVPHGDDNIAGNGCVTPPRHEGISPGIEGICRRSQPLAVDIFLPAEGCVGKVICVLFGVANAQVPENTGVSLAVNTLAALRRQKSASGTYIMDLLAGPLGLSAFGQPTAGPAKEQNAYSVIPQGSPAFAGSLWARKSLPRLRLQPVPRL